MYEYVEREHVEKNMIRYLRIVLEDEKGWDESESFFHSYSYVIRDFTMLERCDVLLAILREWVTFLRVSYWGALCLKSNVRMTDAKTGDWINGDSSQAYSDYFDSGRREYKDNLLYEDEDEDWEWDVRFEALIKVLPLTRVVLEG
jgi:hypothetical protein